MNKSQKGDSEFFVSSTDPAITFNATKELLYTVPAAIKTTAKRSCTTTATATWDAMSPAGFGDYLSYMVGIETFIGDQGAPAQPANVAFDRLDVVVATAGD